MDPIYMSGPWITEHEIKVVEDAMRNGWYNYRYVEMFQKEFAAYHDRRLGGSTGVHIQRHAGRQVRRRLGVQFPPHEDRGHRRRGHAVAGRRPAVSAMHVSSRPWPQAGRPGIL